MPERLAVCFRGYICRGSPAAVKPESSSSTCLQVRESCGFNRGRFQKSVKMRGLFKPGKERTLQIKCNVRICAVVERDKKGKKRAVKITSIICSKVEGAGSRKICEES